MALLRQIWEETGRGVTQAGITRCKSSLPHPHGDPLLGQILQNTLNIIGMASMQWSASDSSLASGGQEGGTGRL